jgi:hypothetical protein
MPSAATIVQDIINQRITQFGRYPNYENSGIFLQHDVSKDYRLRMGYGFFKCEFAGPKVHAVAAVERAGDELTVVLVSVAGVPGPRTPATTTKA